MFALDQSAAGSYHVAQLRAEARRAADARAVARGGLLSRLRTARSRG
jgi:hypothetical protein